MKRRHEVDRRKLEAWSMAFDCGYDYFSELEPFGVVDPAHIRGFEMVPPVGYPEIDRVVLKAARAFLRAAREAWAELGVEYMAAWKPEFPDHPEPPWALQVFGDPRAGPLKSPRTLRR
jgi:hypothetical protein